MARVSLKEGGLGVALGNGRPLASIRVQILVKTTVNDKRQKARIPATKLQWLPARHAILTSGSDRTLDGRESLRAGRDAQLFPCRPAVRYPGPNAHTGPDGRTSVNQPMVSNTRAAVATVLKVRAPSSAAVPQAPPRPAHAVTCAWLRSRAAATNRAVTRRSTRRRCAAASACTRRVLSTVQVPASCAVTAPASGTSRDMSIRSGSSLASGVSGVILCCV